MEVISPPAAAATSGPNVTINQFFALGVQDTVRAEIKNLRPLSRRKGGLRRGEAAVEWIAEAA